MRQGTVPLCTLANVERFFIFQIIRHVIGQYLPRPAYIDDAQFAAFQKIGWL